jgi:type IV pilus assembly protein PilE
MKGFTLVELMIVLLILSVLGALAYPGYAGYIRKSRRIEGQMALLDTLQQEERYYSQHNRYRAFSAEAPPDGIGTLRWWSGRSAAASAYEIDAHACPGQAIDACIEVRAQPGTGQVDAGFRDPECGTLTRDSTGRQTSSGTLDRCWP